MLSVLAANRYLFCGSLKNKNPSEVVQPTGFGAARVTLIGFNRPDPQRQAGFVCFFIIYGYSNPDNHVTQSPSKPNWS